MDDELIYPKKWILCTIVIVRVEFGSCDYVWAKGVKFTQSINHPIRKGLSWHERWESEDKGLIACWENGRELANKDPEKAERAKRGELLKMEWNGGVSKKLKKDVYKGTLFYLAKWQGLRGDDLDIDVKGKTILICSKTGQTISYGVRLSDSEGRKKFTLTS